MRILLDSNVLVRAFVTPLGLAATLLIEILNNGHALVLSNEILAEVSRVLRYPRLAKAHAKSEEIVYNFKLGLREFSEVVPLDSLSHGPVRDAKDIRVLQTAVAGEVEILCTSDRDFFEAPAAGFLESQ